MVDVDSAVPCLLMAPTHQDRAFLLHSSMIEHATNEEGLCSDWRALAANYEERGPLEFAQLTDGLRVVVATLDFAASYGQGSIPRESSRVP